MRLIFDYSFAAILVALGGLLFLISIAISGYTPVTLAIAIVMLLLAEGLRRRMRMVAYLAFILLIVALAVAISGVYTAFGLASMLAFVATLLNVAALIVLFVILWRSKPVAA